MNSYQLLFFFITLVLFSVAIKPYKFSKTLSKFFCFGIVIYVLFFASTLVFECLPGDYSIYTNFFDGCSVSFSKCLVINSFEPGFFFLSYLFANIFRLDPHSVWTLFCLLHLSFIALAIWIFCHKNLVKYTQRISLLSISLAYIFTNFTTLAIRFGLSASMILLSLALFYRSIQRKEKLLASVLILGSVSIHYQALFLIPLLVLFLRTESPASFKFVPLINKVHSLRLQSRVTRLTLFYSLISVSLFIFIVLNFESLILISGKSYYLSGYKSSTLGLRPVVESILILLVSYPFLARRVRSMPYISSLLYINYYFLIFSLTLALASMFLFSIDGFSRQVQFCFLLNIILYYNIDLRSFNVLSIPYLVMPLYVIFISIYSFYSDTSFSAIF